MWTRGEGSGVGGGGGGYRVDGRVKEKVYGGGGDCGVNTQ